MNPKDASEAGEVETPLVSVPLPVLEALIDWADCWFDHHGYCQEHAVLDLEPGEECPHTVARRLFEEAAGHHQNGEQR